MCADHAEAVAAPADLDIETGLEQAQILIQRSTQIREPRVVGGLEIEFSLRLGLGGGSWRFQESSLPRNVCARSSVIATSTN